MRRRDFIKVIAASSMWPLAARAQQSMPVIGYVNSGTAGANVKNIAAFRAGLTEAGLVEGQMSRSNSAGPKTSSIGCQR